MVFVCLPSNALLQYLPSYLGFSYLGHGVSLHGCSSKAQPLLLTLDEGYLLMAAPPDLGHGVAPLGPPAPTQPSLPGIFQIYNIVLLSIIILYITSLNWFLLYLNIYIYIYLLTNFIKFLHLSPPPNPSVIINLVSFYEFIFVFFLDSTYKWDHLILVFLWLI